MYLTSKSHECKGRFQIAVQLERAKRKLFEQAQITGTGSDVESDHIDTETRHCIRNFRVTQIVCVVYLGRYHSLTST